MYKGRWRIGLDICLKLQFFVFHLKLVKLVFKKAVNDRGGASVWQSCPRQGGSLNDYSDKPHPRTTFPFLGPSHLFSFLIAPKYNIFYPKVTFFQKFKCCCTLLAKTIEIQISRGENWTVWPKVALSAKNWFLWQKLQLHSNLNVVC